MTDKDKEVVVKRKGKKIITVKGKNLVKKFDKNTNQPPIPKPSKKFCPNCGSSINGKFCEMCGSKID